MTWSPDKVAFHFLMFSSRGEMATFVFCKSSNGFSLCYTLGNRESSPPQHFLPGFRLTALVELQRRQTFRAGAKWKAKKRNYKPSVPAIIMLILRFLDNKMDELGELIKTQREYHECSLMCFTETWLHFPDHSVTKRGFRTFMVDRDVCLSINKKCELLWMKNGIIPDMLQQRNVFVAWMLN